MSQIPHEALASERHSAIIAEKNLRAELRALTTVPIKALQFVQPGRLARVVRKSGGSDGGGGGVEGEVDWGWGVLLNFKRRADRPRLDSGKKSKGGERPP